MSLSACDVGACSLCCGDKGFAVIISWMACGFQTSCFLRRCFHPTDTFRLQHEHIILFSHCLLQVKVLAQLKHPNIVSYQESFEGIVGSFGIHAEKNWTCFWYPSCFCPPSSRTLCHCSFYSPSLPWISSNVLVFRHLWPPPPSPPFPLLSHATPPPPPPPSLPMFLLFIPPPSGHAFVMPRAW